MFTPKEIAERTALTSSGEEVQRQTERLKHWSKNGLLQPIEGGAGKHRRYDENAVYEAAYLLEMTFCDVPRDLMKYALELARDLPYPDDNFLHQAVASAKNPASPQIWVSIVKGSGYRLPQPQRGPTFSVTYNIGMPDITGTTSLTAINLTRVFKAVRR